MPVLLLAQDFGSQHFGGRKNLGARIWTGVFLMGKTINDRFANKKLLNSHQ